MSRDASGRRVMIRRKQEEVSENHERWVISYADFITLLFAFFVVMYSISSVNEGKYKVLSDSLENVFSDKAKTLVPIQAGKNNQTASSDRLIELPFPGDFPSAEDYKYSIEGVFEDVEDEASPKAEKAEEEIETLAQLSDQLALTLQDLVKEDLASVNSTDDWIEVDIKSSVLFPSGAALPSQKARQIVLKVAQLLKDYTNPIHVEGFTDDIPIQNDFYPSNWELSAARAAAVVRLLELGQVAPDRMAAVGYAEFQPVADNSTEVGRAKNRRVSLIISKQNKRNKVESAVAIPKVSDFKLGAVDNNAARGIKESGDAFDPKSRRTQSESKKQTVPLKIIKLGNGGILFSTESTKPR